MASSTTASGVTVQSSRVSRFLSAAIYFVVRRRIFLTFVMFAALIGSDLLRGVRPHDPANFGDHTSIAGGLLILVGLAIRTWAAGILQKDQELTTCGPYRLVRNPLYLGSFLMMFGFCALIGDPINFVFILGPVLLIYSLKVRSEERRLSSLFPTQWPQFKRQTPRLVPRIGRTDVVAAWRVRQWIRAREYEAVSTALAGLVAIKVWHTIG